ncbi:MAG: redoxin domain-containing protein [Candidatus Kapabacteria bacterium]|nr:redoxin domain-containing protein [Candidatus Kapabacteria bacterium]
MKHHMRHFLFAPFLILATLHLWAAGDDSMNHDGVFLPAPPLAEITRAMKSLPVEQTSERLIVTRYLGYRCSHCVEQITYLNQHSAALKRRGIRVLAVSNDAEGKWSSLVTAYDIDTSVFSYLADERATVARSLGAERITNNTRLDLHATIVRVKGTVRAAVYSESPYMDVARIIGLASEGAESAHAPSAEFVDRYLTSKPTVTTVAGPSDGIQEPIDLDFNRSLMQGDDLWVVMGDKSGHAMAILHNATSKQPAVRLKKDSRAYHFMWRTMGIAMGTNGAFATAQNGEPGDGDQNYMFMGPTLWSSDTAVFASRYQTEERRLASHLDMLHQSPWDLGIAHDTANVYWVLDAKYPGISRYDFRDPHEVGGTDHRDGVIRRYTETSITPAQRGRPAHVCLDKQTGWLYYVDPGAAKVHRLDTRSGRVTDTLEMPPSSAENAAEFTAVTGARFSPVITSGLVEPVGIDVIGTRLLVGDRSTGLISVYDISDTSAILLGTISTGAKELLGITVGPDQRIWFVDRATAKVCRLDLDAENSLSASRMVSATVQGDSISFRYANNSPSTYSPRLKVRWVNSRNGRATAWQSVSTEQILAGQTSDVVVIVPEIDTLAVHSCEIAEFSGSDVKGLTATTTVVPKGLRRVVVQDERNGTFAIREAVALTSRMGYVTIPSDVFNAVADELRSLKTALWNSGSVGEISAVDETVIMSLLGRNVDLFLIADDPLALRLEWPMAGAFFRSLGVSPLGAEQNDSLKGQRIFTGVLGDPVTAGMTLIDCQLPRLDHQRGGKYIPNMLLRPLTNSKTMMLRKGDTASGAVRYEKQTLRCIVLGINASRFMDGAQRTTILDRGLIWLEEAANPDTIATSVNDDAQPGDEGRIVMRRTSASDYQWTAADVAPFGEEHSVAEVYSLTGQRMMTLYEGPLSSAQGTFSSSNLASGCYFVIIRTMNRRLHSTFINQ